MCSHISKPSGKNESDKIYRKHPGWTGKGATGMLCVVPENNVRLFTH